MAQYIDKSAVVAELERRISLFKKEKKTEKWSVGASQTNVISLGARIAMCEELLSFINTLEVKKVDLTEEDMKLVWNLGDEIPYMPEEEFYKELLKRYKAKKGE